MDQMIGEIRLFAFSHYIPMYWLKCDGTVYSALTNQALYALIGNKYGGTAPNTFAVPDLTGSEPDSFMMYCISTEGDWPVRP